jgi:hypothetical protein
MADPKKGGDKKDAKKEGGGGMESEILFFAILLVMLGIVIVPIVLNFFGFNPTSGGLSKWWEDFSFGAERAFSAFTSLLIFVSVFLCLLFVIGIMYAKFKLSQVGHAQEKSVEPLGEVGGKEEAALSMMSVNDNLSFPGNLPGTDTGAPIRRTVVNPKWEEVKKHMESGNQSDWRLAILEADILLYDMLDQMGYEGQSIGEKLKSIEPSSFNTLDEAWRAHKVRNIIAHEGGSYVLSRSEAERAIRWYETVFKEFYFV